MHPAPAPSARVLVTDIDMEFMSMVTFMVTFMVKWAIASIPAAFILALFAMGTVTILGGTLMGILHR